MKKTPDTVTLNDEQALAVETIDGPLLITAGPGTGKTHLLSARAANIMLKKKIPGENIMILTYTNAASKSVKERLAKVAGFEGYRVFVDTFHGFANSAVLDCEEAAPYIRERIQMTDLERIKALEYIVDNFTDSIKELRPFGYPYLYMPEIARKISELKNEGILPDEFEKNIGSIKPDGIYIEEKHIPRLKELAFIYRKYEEIKNGLDKNIFDERGRYDYDDMILLAIKILGEETELKKAYRERYKYVMVDEFQDTNGAQLKLLFLLVDEKKPNLCCVGDDDQSIYRFQGASLANFKILKDRFPDTKIIKLKDNYRSTRQIIDLSLKIIRQIPPEERLDSEKKLIPRENYNSKTIEFMKFSTEDEEIVHIISKINEIVKMIKDPKPYNKIAILLRKRIAFIKLIDAFLKKGIPYATDGKEDISGQKRVRQLIDALKLAKLTLADSEEKNLCLYKVLSCDFQETLHSDILRFINYVNSKKKSGPANFFSEFITAFRVDTLDKKPTLRETKKLPVLKEISMEKPYRLHLASRAVQRLVQDAAARPVHDILMGYIEDSGLYNFILRSYEKKKVLFLRELRSVTSFVNMVKNMSLSRPGLTLDEFLEELETIAMHNMALEGSLVSSTQDGVRIITAHSSKGQEFHTCFIPFCLQDKSWPLRPLPEKIPLPPNIIKTKESVSVKSRFAELSFFDEARLFYVASSRAKSNLIFTASPSEDNVTSSFFDNLGLNLQEKTWDEENILIEFLKQEKGLDPLKDTEEALKDLARSVVLTPTKLNNFLKCRRKFFYDNLLLLPGRKKQSLVFGNCSHKALEDVYRAYKKERRFPDFNFFEDSFRTELKYQGVNKSVENRCLAKLGELRRWFDETKINPVIPLDVEKKKIITLKNGIIFSGKFDKIELEDEQAKLIRIIDYKTGKPDNHIRSLANECDLASEECDGYLRQLVAYKMLYERDTHEPSEYRVGHGVLIFLEPVKKTSRKFGLSKGAFINKEIFITDRMVGELERLIYTVWERIQGLDFDKLPQRDVEKCLPCAFDSICWG